jgi:hypothetical protein
LVPRFLVLSISNAYRCSCDDEPLENNDFGFRKKLRLGSVQIALGQKTRMLQVVGSV